MDRDENDWGGKRKRIKSDDELEQENSDLQVARTKLDEEMATYLAKREPPAKPVSFEDEPVADDKGGEAQAATPPGAVPLELYNDLLAKCAVAREIRPAMYFWTQLHADGHTANSRTYAPLDLLLSKIHQLDNKSSLSNMPYYDRSKTAPPKKWIRDILKERSANRRTEGAKDHVTEVEEWLAENSESDVKNAFKTATAVARAIPELSSAAARTIVIALRKKKKGKGKKGKGGKAKKARATTQKAGSDASSKKKGKELIKTEA